jgi:16S rRNA (guanine(966)-N(2))-methyltransferase RsmD
MIGPFFDGGTVLDLYGGSGGLGIEALSRGSSFSVFVDRASAACQTIRENINLCGYGNCSRVMQLEALRALDHLHENGSRFDLVFLDPPYAKQHIGQDIKILLEREMLTDHAIVVVEHEETVVLPDTFDGGLIRNKYRTYQGQTAVSIYYYQPEQGSDSVE